VVEVKFLRERRWEVEEKDKARDKLIALFQQALLTEAEGWDERLEINGAGLLRTLNVLAKVEKSGSAMTTSMSACEDLFVMSVLATVRS